MNSLADKKCEACREGAPKLSEDEIADGLKALDEGWEVTSVDGVKQLVKTFKLKNYVEATEFGNKLCAIAEQNDHHPTALIEWGKVTVRWWSHKIKGLHENDLIMAAKTDNL